MIGHKKVDRKTGISNFYMKHTFLSNECLIKIKKSRNYDSEMSFFV